MFSRPVRTIDRVSPPRPRREDDSTLQHTVDVHPSRRQSKLTTVLKTVACVQSNRCVGVHPSRMIFRAGRRDAEDREDLPVTPRPHDPVVELCHRRARAPVRDAAERAAARRVATPARLAAVPVAGGPYDLRHHHHLAVNRQRHDLGLPVHRLRLHDDEAARSYIFRGEEHGLGGRLALGLPVRRLRVRPGLLGHDDGLRLRLGLPVHRLRLHDGEAARTYIFRGEDHGLGGRLHDCYGLGDRLHDCYVLGGRLHDCYVLGGRLHDCSLDDCSLDDMAWLLSLSSTKFWREARRLLGLHRVGAATGPRRSSTSQRPAHRFYSAPRGGVCEAEAGMCPARSGSSEAVKSLRLQPLVMGEGE